MLVKIVVILSVISICVDGITPDHQPKHAVSTQSYHRDDVPLSYKFTAVHIYTTTRRPEEHRPYLHSNHQDNSRYNPIQYAPLVKNTYDHGYKHVPEIDSFTNSEESRKSHLEPREVENIHAHDQTYRTFVPGHNIQVLQSSRLKGYNGLYRDYHDNLVNQKVNLPKFITRQSPQQHIQNIPETFNDVKRRPLSEEHKILYSFLPKAAVNTYQNIDPNNVIGKISSRYQIIDPNNVIEKISSRQQNEYVINNSHNVPHTLSAKIPRLHLNLARVYGIAHLNEQAPIKPVHRPIANPPAYTQAIFLPLKAPQKTILYPVQDTKKNYPVHTYIYNLGD